MRPDPQTRRSEAILRSLTAYLAGGATTPVLPPSAGRACNEFIEDKGLSTHRMSPTELWWGWGRLSKGRTV